MPSVSMILQFIAAFHLLVLCGVFLILFVSVATQQGMILGFIRKVKIPGWLVKPLYGCPVCMASIWGSILYIVVFVSFMLGGVELPRPLILFLWPVYCVMLSGAMVMYQEVME